MDHDDNVPDHFGPSNGKYYNSSELIVLERELLTNLKDQHENLAVLLESVSNRTYEDTVYRFYHRSRKVFDAAPHQTCQIVEALRGLAPAGTTLTPLFEEIVRVCTEENVFLLEFNDDWSRHTRPFIEAFFHARYFLEMAVKYGAKLDEAPSFMPSGWAAMLCLYGIR
jgi:hypothetical protein